MIARDYITEWRTEAPWIELPGPWYGTGAGG